MDRPQALRFYASVTAGVVAVVATLLLRGAGGKRAHGSAPSAEKVELADWCPNGLEPIAGGACYAAPNDPSESSALLLYLHGRYAPETAHQERERQVRVARLATARGYAVLAFRGLPGQCTDPKLATWFCWPSNERNQTDAPAFVARFRTSLEEASRRHRVSRLVLLGFSNGGYFAGLIARDGLLPVDAVAIAHAGPVEPMRAEGPMPPLLLIDADDDPSGPEMDRLQASLSQLAWPFVTVAREGGHALLDWDVEMALTFFDRTRTEHMPLTPPLPARSRRNAGSSPPSVAEAGPPTTEPPNEDERPSRADAATPGDAAPQDAIDAGG